MFKLSEQELDNAFSAINHHGYSAMLPKPVEWAEVENNWKDIKDNIKEIDLDNYEPYKPMKIFAPKSRANIRVVHLLHPQDLIIYTALTLIVKDDIEKERLSKQTQRVFSFRVDTKKADRLYDSRGDYSLFTDQLNKKAQKKSVKYVGVADIADFYPKIYQHRLENVIQTLDHNPRSNDVARVLIVKYVLTKLPLIPSLPDRFKHQILDVVIENAGLLYPASEEIAKYVLSFAHLAKSEKKKIANKLLKPLTSRHNPPPDYYVMWILYIFSTSEDWNHIKDIIKIYKDSNSEITKRYATLAIAKGGSRNEALIVKDDIISASALFKLAILEATKKLGKDERKHWKRTHQFSGILEKKI